MTKNRHPLFLSVIGLAGFGFIYQLFTNPLGLLSTFVMFGLVIAIFVFIYRWLSQKDGFYPTSHHSHPPASSGSHSRTRNPLTAVPVNRKKSTATPKQKKKRKNHPFKVIEGNKGKDRKKRLSSEK